MYHVGYIVVDGFIRVYRRRKDNLVKAMFIHPFKSDSYRYDRELDDVIFDAKLAGTRIVVHFSNLFFCFFDKSLSLRGVYSILNNVCMCERVCICAL